MKLNMNKILLLAGLITLLASTGCIIADGERRGHARYERHEEIRVGPPVLIVRPPEVIVR